MMVIYTDYAGLEISVNSRIASLFLQQIAIGNAGPVLALESMGANGIFAAIFKILVLATNSKREKVVLSPKYPHHVHYYLLKSMEQE